MTRIIVKNLPDSVTSDKLKEKFSIKGQITDVQLKYADDGKFRHFGFIGFKTDEEADVALNYFHNTYVGSCKIQVERCVNLGDRKKRPKVSKTLPEATDKKSKKKEKNTDEKAENDPEFAEFLEIHSNRQKDKSIWDNDGIDGNLSKTVKKDKIEEEAIEDVEIGEAQDTNLTDLEYLKSKVVGASEGVAPKLSILTAKKIKTKVEYFTVKVRGFPSQAKKKDIKQFFAPQKPDSIRLPPKIKGVAYLGFATEIEWKKALNKNRSFHEGHRILVSNYVKKSETAADVEEKEKGKKDAWIQQEDDLKKEETVAESGRLFIRNLSYSVTEDELEALFTPFGPLAEIHLPIDKHSRKVKGFAFVTYVMPEHAVKAYAALDGTVFQGRMFHLIASKSKPTDEDAEGGDPSNFKQKKLKEQKSQANSSHNWNTLFLGTNAVATLMADRYETTKQQVLLEGDGQHSVAVRLALGETQLVAETKQFLSENGIHLEVFNEAPKLRSKTVILVKNLDAQSTVDEIRDLFSPFGELGRVLLPPRGVTAIVEFLEPTEAKIAFRKIAYSKFRHMPLYLEWAPVNVFKTAPPAPTSKKNQPTVDSDAATAAATTSTATTPATTSVNVQDDDDDDEPDPDATLFVKNLNFSTVDDMLKEHFIECGSVFTATVAKKKDPKNPGQVLSMGYGFVQFRHKKAADTALKTLQHSNLDGHVIELKRSSRTSDAKNDVKATARKTSSKNNEPISSKLLVRNVPFEALTVEVVELFKPFGELKAVRLPKKSVGSGTHRGFAFVEYVTKQDAKKAFESLSVSTHLYGRRLVLEWAASEDTVEDVRRRTTSHFPEGPPAKKSRAVEEFGGAPDSD